MICFQYPPYLHKMLVPGLQVAMNEKTGNQYPPRPPIPGIVRGGRGNGYLFIHHWPSVDQEHAIYVDKVNNSKCQMREI